MTSISTSTPRTFGHWRRRRGFEVMGLSTGQLGVVLGGVVIPLMVLLFATQVGLVLLIAGVAAIVAVCWRQDGQPRVVTFVQRRGWQRAAARGQTSWQSEVVKPFPRAEYLPGPLAPIELLSVRQPTGGLAAWLWDRRGGYLTGQLRLNSIGTLLANSDDADGWVDAYGAWQASLGHIPGLRSACFVVETAPSGANRLRDHVADRLEASAPAMARDWMIDLVESMPGQSTEINQWASITIDPRRLATRPATIVQSVADASLTLTGVADSLSSGGIDVVGRATPGWTAGRLRAAFDPAMRGQIERERNDEAELAWTQAGPVAAREEWDHLRHDSGFSVTFALRELPRSQVRHDILRRLLAPGRWPRRVAISYTPYPAQVAESVVDAELNAAAVRETAARKTKRDFTVREQMDARRATTAAVEQTQGAGLGEPGILVTVTTTSLDELPQAVADLETRARGARLRMVRMYGAQMLGFCATLGVGVDAYDLAARTPGRGK